MGKNKKVEQEVAVVEENIKETKKETKSESSHKKPRRKREKKSFGRKIKEIFSELKKVSWPTFPQVVKSTAVVLVVVLIFLIILGVFDGLLAYLAQLIV